MLDNSPLGLFVEVSPFIGALLWLWVLLGRRARSASPGATVAAADPAFAVITSQFTYWCSLAISALSMQYIPPGSIRTAVMLTPVLTMLFCVSTAYWMYKACDEYVRLQVVKCVVWTALGVSICTLAYYFLELLGYPRQSMLWVNLLGWSLFSVLMVWVILRAR